MKIRYPAYYDQFRCIASACPDSCCKEWDVLVDAETAARYLALEGSLGDDLRSLLQLPTRTKCKNQREPYHSL